MIYLGTLGRMVGLKCPASQQVAVDERITFEPTLGGRKVGQIAPGSPKRVWQSQLSDASTPDQVGAVMAFINREWGNGPFVFVSADAPVTNMLTPAAAACDPSLLTGSTVLHGGPMLTPAGWAGRSAMNSNPANLLGVAGNEYIPVLPGTKVTASAYVLGAGAHVSLYFYDANLTQVSSVSAAATGTAGYSKRSAVTGSAPANAVCARLFAVNATQATRPALTWSDTLLPWADGQGCQKAVIHGASRDLVMASRDSRGGRYSNLSFTITEVG